jgi:hypothetical protein
MLKRFGQASKNVATRITRKEHESASSSGSDLGTKRVYQRNSSRRREEIIDHSEAHTPKPQLKNLKLLVDFSLQLQYNPLKML